jgi:hypothetical protein
LLAADRQMWLCFLGRSIERLARQEAIMADQTEAPADAALERLSAKLLTLLDQLPPDERTLLTNVLIRAATAPDVSGFESNFAKAVDALQPSGLTFAQIKAPQLIHVALSAGVGATTSGGGGSFGAQGLGGTSKKF